MGLIAIILASFFLFEDDLLKVWHNTINSNASLTVIGLLIVGLLAADVVLPTPSSVVSLAAAMIFGTHLGGLLIFTGMSICCLLGYYLGRSGHSIVNKHVDNNQKTDEVFRVWAARWGPWSLLFSRPIPVLAETTIVLAGLTKLPFKKFLLFTLPANAITAMVYGLSVVLIN